MTATILSDLRSSSFTRLLQVPGHPRDHYRSHWDYLWNIRTRPLTMMNKSTCHRKTLATWCGDQVETRWDKTVPHITHVRNPPGLEVLDHAFPCWVAARMTGWDNVAQNSLLISVSANHDRPVLQVLINRSTRLTVTYLSPSACWTIAAIVVDDSVPWPMTSQSDAIISLTFSLKTCPSDWVSDEPNLNRLHFVCKSSAIIL